MTGPEHYSEAERLLASVREMHVNADASEVLGQAAVHAQLAQVAATMTAALASKTYEQIDRSQGLQDWVHVLAPPR